MNLDKINLKPGDILLLNPPTDFSLAYFEMLHLQEQVDSINNSGAA